MANGSSPIDTLLMNVVPVFIAIVFIIIGFVFFGIIRKAVKQWSYNNSQPVRVAAAKVVAKRTHVFGSAPSDAADHSGGDTSTYYYVTFELEDGQRMELAVMGQEYGLVAEKDRGKLKFQGTRYLGFARGA